MKGLIALLVALSSVGAHVAASAAAGAGQVAVDLADATRTLAAARTLRGRFTQTRTLKELPRPLVAEGEFLFARDHGIVWRTTAPFPSELLITRDDIVVRGADHPGAPYRGAGAVAGVFFAVFALDFHALESMFELSSRRDDQGWTLVLKPRAALAGALGEIAVSGRSHVERVQLRDAAGELTEVKILDPRPSPEPPSAEELKRLSR